MCRFDSRSHAHLHQSVFGRVPRNLEWTDHARGAASPRSPSRNGSAGFFPLPRSSGIPREAKKPATAVLRCAAGLTAAGRSLPGPRTAIEAAMVAARQQNGDHHGYHRHLHCVEQRLHRLGQDPYAQRQGDVRRDREGQRQGSRLSHPGRRHLAACGKFAVVTPPAMTMLLSTSLTSNAIAQSGGNSSKGNNGFGNGGGDGSPNGKEDINR
ncbi:MAG: hypothetical protein JWP25_2100 [Bradyrhizobium sp.]|nr:hypothetical protein [Bradyrhizobium sp.]